MHRRPDLEDLPPVLPVKVAAQIVHVSADTLYEAIRTGACPWPVLRIGRTIRIPTAAVLASLGVGDDQ